MITPEILSYIKTERVKNTPDSVIQQNLLANGWNDADVGEAFASLTSIPQPPINNSELKRYQNKKAVFTFLILLIVDAILIMWLGGRGLFGLSPLSIVARVAVIFGISYFSARGSRPEKTAIKGAMNTVGRIIGAVIIAAVVIMGLLFAYCLFSVAGR